ncbi:hypothetical protein [Caulobacter endophyticus]|uniref:hypothetical protein n=1 Tax=Caulobacter endophyticus TaxID=2172652 RepID=UPI00240FE6BD|nr:hypothetical protein [Caulobacter endophyticus]MDG2530003.1 hypothetical protein [Caulobacter endophyticus]
MAALAVGGVAVAVILHDPLDAPAHASRECGFITALEAKRMVRSDAGGPVPFEIWRAEDATGGPPRPRHTPSRDAPWWASLVLRTAPRSAPPINCAAQMNAAGIPRVLKYNDGPTRQIDRQRYSRIVFSPGDRYALSQVSFCHLDDNGWDEESRLWIWRREGGGWTPILGDSIQAVYEMPRFQPPMRCFQRPDG